MPECLSRHRPGAITRKQNVSGRLANEQLWPGLYQIFLKPRQRDLSHRDQALLAAFTADTDHALSQVDLTQGQRDQFRNPETGCVHQLKHRAISLSLGLFYCGRLEQRIDILLSQGFG